MSGSTTTIVAALLVALASGAVVLAVITGVRLWRATREVSARDLEIASPVADVEDVALALAVAPSEAGDAEGDLADRADVTSILRTSTRKTTRTLDAFLTSSTRWQTVQQQLERVHPEWSAGTLLTFVTLGALAGLLAGLTLGFLTGVIVMVVGMLLPVMQGQRRHAARRKAIEAQLPAALDMLVNGLRAGYALNQAMRFVGQELPAPLGPEFTRYVEEQQMGIDQRQALLALQQRLDLLDARMFVLALLIQRETGGGLAEVLGNVAAVLRHRQEFRQQLTVLTAEASLSSVILAGLPVVLFLLMQLVSPAYMSALLEYKAGVAMLLYGGVSTLVGFLLLRQLANPEL